MSMTVRTRVIGYTRVSTTEQAGEGVSLDAQRAKLQAYALAMDLDLVAIHTDAGLSAGSLKRPGLARALADLEAGRAAGVLVCKLDRLTRSVRDLGTLIDHYFGRKFSLLSVNDAIDTRSASGLLVLNVLTSVGQWERQAAAERTRETLRYLKAQGVQLGGAALGWRRLADTDENGRRVIERLESEVATVERIRALQAQGLSRRMIARTLTADGVPSKNGGRWSHQVVGAVLRRAGLA